MNFKYYPDDPKPTPFITGQIELLSDYCLSSMVSLAELLSKGFVKWKGEKDNANLFTVSLNLDIKEVSSFVKKKVKTLKEQWNDMKKKYDLEAWPMWTCALK